MSVFFEYPNIWPGLVVHTFNPRRRRQKQVALWVPDQPGLQSKFWGGLGLQIETLLKQEKEKEEEKEGKKTKIQAKNPVILLLPHLRCSISLDALSSRLLLMVPMVMWWSVRGKFIWSTISSQLSFSSISHNIRLCTDNMQLPPCPLDPWCLVWVSKQCILRGSAYSPVS